MGCSVERRGLVAALAAWVGAPTWAQRADAALRLAPDAPARRVPEATPAAGPLARLASTVGGWHALLELPLEPGCAMQLLWWPVARRERRDALEAPHRLSLLALDEAPDDAPRQAFDLPLLDETSPPQRTLRFGLGAHSAAARVYVLAQWWRPDGAPPPRHWVALRSAVPRPTAAVGRPGPGHVPPSPLTQALADHAMLTLPFTGAR